MEPQSGRSSVMSERHRSMAVDRTTPLSRISRPGSAVDLLLDRMGEIQANIGAVHADTRNAIEALHADIGAVHANIDAVQAETREVLETVMLLLGWIGTFGNIACAKVCCGVS